MVKKLPDFQENTYLPQGVYEITWIEIEQVFGTNQYRKMLLQGLKEGLKALKDCNCRRAYLNGGFVSNNERPGDFDVCYEEAGMDFKKLKDKYEPLTIFDNRRALQKKIYGGEFHPAHNIADKSGINYYNFFQQIKYSDPPEKKGIVAINLDTL